MNTDQELFANRKNHVKVTLPESVAVSLQATLKELRIRGADIRPEDLLEDAFKALNEHYWDRQIDRLTPDEYLLTLAAHHPEAKLYLIQQARRALDLMKKGEPIVKSRKKPGPKPKSTETQSL